MSAKATKLNPQDVMFPTLIEQVSHVTRIYETVLGRTLSGTQRENLERGLLGEALEILYRGFPDLNKVSPELAPTCDVVCDVLSGLGDKEATRHIAKNLADEIAGLCTGSGPWSEFLNGATNVDLSRGGRERIEPRVFSFHELESDPILQALAYTQVLSAIRRDSLIDEQPRIIAVDEVYRLMRHPSLLDFLIEAAKTFRTRRKKLVAVDQINEQGVLADYDVVLKSVPALRVLTVRRDLPEIAEMRAMMLNMLRVLPSQVGARRLRHMIVITHAEAYDTENFDVEIGYIVDDALDKAVRLPEEPQMTVRTLEPVETMATVTRVGASRLGSGCYRALAHWIEGNAYHIAGPGREVFLHLEANRDEEMVTEIQMPIEKALPKSLLPVQP